ncbi:fimbria/pilus periplasmic chaperone (plasmid) [Yersinia sp. HM-2024]|uniref:fimbria/pilus periplasmic chaperone n=1 Tax=Yersinia sp. HM-2024 TaxID=3344550 RepID=UPI00370D304B
MRSGLNYFYIYFFSFSPIFYSGNALSLPKEENTKLEQQIKYYSVGLGATRVIYNSNSRAESVSVKNPNDYPILVKSKVFMDDKKTEAHILANPSLFILDGEEQSRIRLVRLSDTIVTDRENLLWLCVKGIPPENDDAWVKEDESAASKSRQAMLDVKIVVDRCIKIIERPNNIKSTPNDMAGKLEWKNEKGKILINNPGPHYMIFSFLSIDGVMVKEPGYIPPFSKQYIEHPAGNARSIQWRIINDLGGDSRSYANEL